MKSVLRDIYHGEQKNIENFEESNEYWEVHKKYDELYEKLLQGLNEEQKKILDDLYVLSGGLESEASCTWFREGFKMGLLIAVEVFN